MDSYENEIYKFLEVEQADGIKTRVVFERVKSEGEKRVKMLVNTEFDDANLISAFNAKVIPAATYMNVCKFTIGEQKSWARSLKENSDQRKCLVNRHAMREFT